MKPEVMTRQDWIDRFYERVGIRMSEGKYPKERAAILAKIDIKRDYFNKYGDAEDAQNFARELWKECRNA